MFTESIELASGEKYIKIFY